MVRHAHGHLLSHGTGWQLVSVDRLILHGQPGVLLKLVMLLGGGGPGHVVLGGRRSTSLWLIVRKPWTGLCLARVVGPSLRRALLIRGVGVGHFKS